MGDYLEYLVDDFEVKSHPVEVEYNIDYDKIHFKRYMNKILYFFSHDVLR